MKPFNKLRLSKQIQYLKVDSEPLKEYYDIWPDPFDLSHFYLTVFGPKQTPFEKGVFKLEIHCQGYPYIVPKIIMKTKIKHPDIDQLGRFCYEVLEKCWCPAITIHKFALMIWALVFDPEIQGAKNQEDLLLYKSSFDEYQQRPRKGHLLLLLDNDR